MRQRGYKEVRYWVPDVSSPEFASRIKREVAAINEADRRENLSSFLEEAQAEVGADE